MRSTRSLAMAAVLAVLATLVAVSPAHAASQGGNLEVQGPGGSAYSFSPTSSRSGVPGATLSFAVAVYNVDTDISQFKVVVDSDLPPSVYKGSLLLNHLANNPDGYYTAPIAPYKTEVLTIKVKLPAAYDGIGVYATNVNLFSTDGNFLQSVHLISNMSVKQLNPGPNEFVTANSQAKVGGALQQVMTANTVAVGSTATYTFTIQNTDPTPAYEQFNLSQVTDCANVVTSVSNSVSGKDPNGLEVYVKGNSTATITVTLKFVNNGCPYDQAVYATTLTDVSDSDPANWVDATTQLILMNAKG